MTQATEILTELEGRGVSVTVEGDVLCLKPKRKLDDALLARVRDAKSAILEVLRGTPTCWHCSGSGECNCVSCGVMKPSVVWAAGECVVCKARNIRTQ